MANRISFTMEEADKPGMIKDFQDLYQNKSIQEMKKNILFGIICSLILFASCQSPDHFRDAVAVWTFSDLNDHTVQNSQLIMYGDVRFVNLKGEEAESSKKRGGDGIAALFNDSWFNAGQGVEEELNISGKQISILVRMKTRHVKGFIPLINKAGSDQNIAYGISLRMVENELYIESMIGSDDIGGAHLLKYKLPEEEWAEWHDIFFRFNGKISELYVDGILRDDEVTVGEIRDWNRRPVLIGAQYKAPCGYTCDISDNPLEATFEGLIDHIVLWDRYLNDENVKAISGVDKLSNGKPEYYQEKYRPQFHFSARKNWLNDPNGLVYDDGIYHLFFQYMPPHRPGAYKDWGHAVSSDLVHWEQIPHHITPHRVWSGCWSGSAVVDKNNSAGFQTGEKKVIFAFITNGGDPHNGLGPMCTQCIAYSKDGGKTFTYYDQNPVIRNIHNANRDPKVVWDETSGQWIMSLYMDRGFEFGLFASHNLKDWKYLSSVSLEGVTECPGFESLPVDGNKDNKKWLLFGANGNYAIGSFDGINFKPETKVLRGDYGINYYAAQTWNNVPDDKCILIAWMPTQRYPGMPFEQQMNFPTEMTLKTTSQGIRAFRMPVDEIKNLYDKEYKWVNKSFEESNQLFQDLENGLYDMELEIDIKNCSSFEIGLKDVTLNYNAASKTLSCGGIPVKNGIIPDNWISENKAEINHTNNLGKAPLVPVNGILQLRILLDRTSIEIFGNNGEVVITSCFMPTEENKKFVLASEGKANIIHAKIHSLQSIWKK